MIHEKFVKLLKKVAPFTEKELAAADPFFEIIKLKKNDLFLKEGQTSGKIGFVISGLLRCYHIIKNKEITTEFLLPGSIAAGMLSFLTNEPQRENIVALERTEMVTISKEDLFKLYDNSWKWQQTGRILTEMNYVRIEKRSICLQTLTARERYDELLKEMPGLIDLVPLQYIASYLGMSPETFSRIRSK
ncbi:MAG: Crp/Fnr family transcriptional regulator [Bacteroidales bacterium]|nr:Crp/Fnr family transcriptional regulator [Bacteroidales bacterium]